MLNLRLQLTLPADLIRPSHDQMPGLHHARSGRMPKEVCESLHQDIATFLWMNPAEKQQEPPGPQRWVTCVEQFALSARITAGVGSSITDHPFFTAIQPK